MKLSALTLYLIARLFMPSEAPGQGMPRRGRWALIPVKPGTHRGGSKMGNRRCLLERGECHGLAFSGARRVSRPVRAPRTHQYRASPTWLRNLFM